MRATKPGGRALRWLLAGVLAALVLAVGGPWVYINFVNTDQPAALTAPAAATGTDSAGSASITGIDGTWTVASGSVAGYRVEEVLFGQDTTAVGRTSSIEGSLEVSGTGITAAGFTVDMASVASDESRRDSQFRGRIMETSRYPEGTFKLTGPIDLGSAGVSQKTVTVTGDLTLHGVTKRVSVKVTATRKGSTVNVTGSLPITFEDFGIDNPSFGPAQVGDEGMLEFSLNFAKA